ncbi:GlsB/YeaQ/YmgE family stress response membrane protein [Algicella marina]|uniref:GlsB/YeaQ/YmgE family stress response membrane protein n=1 Tax=Algicella marina TaxID=2683284 RepID=A0A6P1T6F7_9RHOB|nr:GlsB/YeaQ/YmgE family stress response membrane protein [Algicella marina]QHQ37066.1 GlsB/YeaQ/YmgE family stress response membrane protein [Algicella marina]
MGFIILLVVGSAAGFVATRAMGIRLPLPQTVALGVIGAILGIWVIRLALGFLGLFAWFASAFLGVVLLLWGYKTFIEKR